MITKELQEQYPEAFRKIGCIVYNLNRLEMCVVTVLSIFFTDESDVQSEKNFILNDALWDEKIFPTFEAKRQMLIKVIKHVWRVAEEKRVDFDKDKWLAFCKSMSDVQEVRNDLAHHSFGFLPDGKVRYHVRKKNEERLHDQKTGGPKGTMKSIDIDLDKELEKSQNICDEADKFVSEFIAETRRVLTAVRDRR